MNEVKQMLPPDIRSLFPGLMGTSTAQQQMPLNR